MNNDRTLPFRRKHDSTFILETFKWRLVYQHLKTWIERFWFHIKLSSFENLKLMINKTLVTPLSCRNAVHLIRLTINCARLHTHTFILHWVIYEFYSATKKVWFQCAVASVKPQRKPLLVPHFRSNFVKRRASNKIKFSCWIDFIYSVYYYVWLCGGDEVENLHYYRFQSNAVYNSWNELHGKRLLMKQRSELLSFKAGVVNLK